MSDTVKFYGEGIPYRLCESSERALQVLHANQTGATGYTHYYQERAIKTGTDGELYFPLYRYGDGIRDIRILHGSPDVQWRIVCDDGRTDLQLPLEVLSTPYYEFYMVVTPTEEVNIQRKLSYTVQYVHLPYSQRIKYSNMMNPMYLQSLYKEKEVTPQ